MGVLLGRVVDAATGQPITQFRVRLGFPAEFRAGDVRGTFDSRLGDAGRTFQAEDGTFTLGGLMNRLALAVTVESDGYGARLCRASRCNRRQRLSPCK